eukprot:scaffold139995_cov39-Cyclotella_meneghiniana.AAC.3
MSEEVIELSIAETQALRAKLGLAPLRLDDDDAVPSSSSNTNAEDTNDGVSPSTGGNDKEISLSISETNKLRLKLGLAPLEVDDAPNSSSSTGGGTSKEVHAPPPTDKRTLQEAADRIQDAKDRRAVSDKLSKWKEEGINADNQESALDFAAKLRNKSATATSTDKKKKKKLKAAAVATAPTSIPNEEEDAAAYTSSDLQ